MTFIQADAIGAPTNSPSTVLANRTMPTVSVIPELVYDDVNEACDWLCRVFGFRDRWRAGDHRAQLRP